MFPRNMKGVSRVPFAGMRSQAVQCDGSNKSHRVIMAFSRFVHAGHGERGGFLYSGREKSAMHVLRPALKTRVLAGRFAAANGGAQENDSSRNEKQLDREQHEVL